MLKHNGYTWKNYYRMCKQARVRERKDKSERIKKEILAPPICPCCGQPCNTRNDAEQYFDETVRR